MSRALIAAIILSLAATVFAEAPPVVLALTGLDPVELTKGNEVAGKEYITVTRGRYKYQFATAQSKAVYEKAPAAFSIQWNGACGRMGPLSGNGDPERWFVYDKKIYIFASEACRNSFKASPEKHIDKADEQANGTAEQRKRGKELVDLAVKGIGDAAAIDAIDTLRLTYHMGYPQKGKADFVMKREVAIAFPDKFRQEDSYEGWNGIYASTPEGGFATSRTVSWSLDEHAVAVFRRDMQREPLVILKCRGDKGFTAIGGGKDKVETTEVELLTVSFAGATTTLAIDPKTGRVLQTRYQGRAPSAIGSIIKTFSDFKPAEKLMLPFGELLVQEGRRITIPAVALEKVAINEKLDAKMFKKPE